MSVRYEERGSIIAVLKDDRQVGTLNPNQDQGVGYSLFGTPHMGAEKDLEAAKTTVERHLD